MVYIQYVLFLFYIMKHGYKKKKLGRKSSHRMSMLKNMAISLLNSTNGIKSTLPKLKALRPFFEKLVTKAKRNEVSLHTRRMLLSTLFNNEKAVSTLIDIANTKFCDRKGGYTRIYKLNSRVGDVADIGMISFVD